MPLIPKTNAEARLRRAAPCGVIRDTHEMTMVRLADVQAIIESEDYYRQRAIALDAKQNSDFLNRRPTCEHQWAYDEHQDIWRCPCGATKQSR